ncbi:MAG: hypothetical protein QOH21_1613 [Acidobacteriota bacterium]|jgi:hypothetical protein|nr:hypothetical protein [Acidobacteriota bacterium]
MTSLAFVACVESGALEQKARLLVRSIRRFGGAYRDAAIHTFSPRAGRGIGEATRTVFAQYAVQHHEEILNVDFDEYGVGNKIFAAARAEELANEDVVVFVDSDTVVLSEPSALALPEGIDVAVRPVDFHRWQEPEDEEHWRTRHRRLSSAGEGDRGDEYWLRMYELCGVEARPFVETSCDRVRIRAYANSGLVAARRSAGVFGQWQRDFLTLAKAGHRPAGGDLHYLDQLSLAATLARYWDRVEVLDGRYNYPLVGRPLLAEPLRSARLDELVHVHYNRYFHDHGFLAALQPPLERDGEVVGWLQEHLPLPEHP